MTDEIKTLRDEITTRRAQFYRGECSMDDLYVAADRYILAVTKRAMTLAPPLRRRFRPPTRAYLLRAL